MPPRLSATALLWWGAGMIVTGAVGNVALPRLASELYHSSGAEILQTILLRPAAAHPVAAVMVSRSDPITTR